MRLINFLLGGVIIISFASFIFAQPTNTWLPPVRLTQGFNDRNPAFAYEDHLQMMSALPYEMIAFERHIATYSNICVLKIGPSGAIDSVTYITNNNFVNRNPYIDYFYNSSTGAFNVVVLWETNQFGQWDIRGRAYRNSAWGSVFTVDASSGDKFHPAVSCWNDSVCHIVYEKAGDIRFRTYNYKSYYVQYDTNLTANESALCSEPYLARFNSSVVYVVYHLQKPDSKFAIYYRKSTQLPNWSLPDTIAWIGNNKFSSFTGDGSTYGRGVAFTSTRQGFSNIYGRTLEYPQQQEILFPSNPGFDYSQFKNSYYELIVDYIPFIPSGFFKRQNDSLKLMLTYGYNLRDSTVIGDTSKHPVLTMNRHIYYNPYIIVFWAIYNKDSATYSNLWGRRMLFFTADLKKINTEVPSEHYLSQNYPNPFNTGTLIRFSITNCADCGEKGTTTTLKIYDMLGREVKTLLSTFLPVGVYEIRFNSGDLPSGVYYYRLETKRYVSTKRMVILK